jgi:hypothetical protein
MPALLRVAIVACIVVAACGPKELYYRNAQPDAGQAGTTGVAGTGLAGVTGAAGSGAAGSGLAGTGAAGAGVAGTTGSAGTGSTGVAGSGTTGAAGAGSTGVAGSGSTGAAGTNAQAGSTGADGGAAGSGPTGAAGAPASKDGGTFINTCSSIHWIATASTPTSSNDVPTNAFDGNVTTRWGTGAPQRPGMYFQIDFGGTARLTQVVLDTSTHQGDYPRGYDVGLSADGTTFKSVATGAGAAGGVLTINFAAAEGRYLRITMTATDGLWWSIDEVRLGCTVPGAGPGLIDPYDPASWTATASKTGAGDTPAKAIDADKNTRWSTGANQVGGETFTLDLGGVAAITEVWLDHGGGNDWPAVFKLEVSKDNATWTELGSGAGMQLNKVVFARRDVRWIRVTQTGSAARFWAIYGVTIKP